MRLLTILILAQLTPQQQSVKDSYNSTYRDDAAVYNPAPSAFLAEVIRELKPGRVIDVGMGQGRNAIFLAQQGWTVTGLDLSDEGIRQAKEQAAKLKLNIETINAPIESYDFGRDKWDLILFCYLDPRPYADKLVAALRPGGALIVEGFHKRTSRTRLMSGWFDDNELLRIFPTLRVLRYEDVLDKQDWGFQMVERNQLVKFAAVRAAPDPRGCRWEGRAFGEGQTVCWASQNWRCETNGWSRAGDCKR